MKMAANANDANLTTMDQSNSSPQDCQQHESHIVTAPRAPPTPEASNGVERSPDSPIHTELDLEQLLAEIPVYSSLIKARLTLLGGDVAAAASLIKQTMQYAEKVDNPHLEAKCLHHYDRIEGHFKRMYGTDLQRRHSSPALRSPEHSSHKSPRTQWATVSSTSSFYNKLLREVQEPTRPERNPSVAASTSSARIDRIRRTRTHSVDLRRAQRLNQRKSLLASISEPSARKCPTTFVNARAQPGRHNTDEESFVGIDKLELLLRQGLRPKSVASPTRMRDAFEGTNHWTQNLCSPGQFTSPNHASPKRMSQMSSFSQTSRSPGPNDSISVGFDSPNIKTVDDNDRTSNMMITLAEPRSLPATSLHSSQKALRHSQYSVGSPRHFSGENPQNSDAHHSRLRLSGSAPTTPFNQPWTSRPPRALSDGAKPSLLPLPKSQSLLMTKTPTAKPMHIPPQPPSHLQTSPTSLTDPSKARISHVVDGQISPLLTDTPSLPKLLQQANANPSSTHPTSPTLPEDEHSTLGRLRKLSVGEDLFPEHTSDDDETIVTNHIHRHLHDSPITIRTSISPMDHRENEPVQPSPLRETFSPEELQEYDKEDEEMYDSPKH